MNNEHGPWRFWLTLTGVCAAFVLGYCIHFAMTSPTQVESPLMRQYQWDAAHGRLKGIVDPPSTQPTTRESIGEEGIQLRRTVGAAAGMSGDAFVPFGDDIRAHIAEHPFQR